MKRLFLLIFLFSSLAYAGGGRYDNIVIDQVGNAVAGATIRICVAGAINLPCSPTAPIFQDLGLTIPKSNPFNADSLGNFFFYAAGGVRYTVQITGTNITSHTMADQFIPDETGGGGGTCDTTNCFVNGGNAFGTALATLGTTNNKDLKVITNNVEKFRTTAAGLTQFASGSTGVTIANKGTTGRIAWPDAFLREDDATTGENVGFGDGVTTHFTFTLLQYPVKPTTFKIFVNLVQKGSDNGAGVLTGVGIVAGTINYTTGAVDVTFTAAPAVNVYVSITDTITTNLIAGTTAPHAFLSVPNQIAANAIGAEFAALSYLSLVTPPILTPSAAHFGSIDLYAKDNSIDQVGDKALYQVDQAGNERKFCYTDTGCLTGIGPDPRVVGGFLGAGYYAAAASGAVGQLFGSGPGSLTSRWAAPSSFWAQPPIFCINATAADGVGSAFQWQKLEFSSSSTDGSFDPGRNVLKGNQVAGCYRNDTSYYFQVSGGERLAAPITASTTIASPTISELSSQVVGTYVIPLGVTTGNQVLGAGLTDFIAGFGGSSLYQTDEDVTKTPLIAGTLQHFCILTGSAQGAGGSLVATVRINGADSAIVMTVPLSGGAGQYCSTATAVITDGQTYDISVLNNHVANSAQVNGFSGELDPVTHKTAMLVFAKNVPANALTASQTRYWASFAGAQALQTAPADAWFGMPRAFTFDKIRCFVKTAPATDPTSFTLYKGTNPTALTGSLATGFGAPGVFTISGSALVATLDGVTLETITGPGAGPVLANCVASGTTP